MKFTNMTSSGVFWRTINITPTRKGITGSLGTLKAVLECEELLLYVTTTSRCTKEQDKNKL